MMTAGFQRDVSGGTTGSGTRLAQGVDFGVACTGGLMPAAPHYLACLHQHATHPGSECPATQRETKRERSTKEQEGGDEREEKAKKEREKKKRESKKRREREREEEEEEREQTKEEKESGLRTDQQ